MWQDHEGLLKVQICAHVRELEIKIVNIFFFFLYFHFFCSSKKIYNVETEKSVPIDSQAVRCFFVNLMIS